MFYAHFVLAKKGPLARIWLAAHWDKKLTKAHVFETNIETSVEGILQPKVKMALRTSGHLLLGIVRIYSRKAKYLLADCNEAFIKIKMAFRPGVVDLPEENRQAEVAAITLPEVFHDFDSPMTDINIDMGPQTLNQSRVEDITIKEDFGHLNVIDEDFGMSFDENEMFASSSNMNDFGHSLPNINSSQLNDSIIAEKEADICLSQLDDANKNPQFDTTLKDDGFGAPVGQGIIDSVAGEFFNPAGLFDEAPPGPDPSRQALAGGTLPEQSEDRADESDDDDVYAGSMGPPSFGSPSGPSSPDSLMGHVDNLDALPNDHQDHSAIPPAPIDIPQQTPFMAPPHIPEPEPLPVIDQTTLIHNEEESFALAPLDTTFPHGPTGVEKAKTKRKRKLIVDEVKNISGEEMKSQLSDTTDIVTTLDLAPPTKRLMHWKETGGVEKLFALSGKPILSKTLSKLYQRHLTTKPIENEESILEIEVEPPEKSPVSKPPARKKQKLDIPESVHNFIDQHIPQINEIPPPLPMNHSSLEMTRVDQTYMGNRSEIHSKLSYQDAVSLEQSGLRSNMMNEPELIMPNEEAIRSYDLHTPDNMTLQNSIISPQAALDESMYHHQPLVQTPYTPQPEMTPLQPQASVQNLPIQHNQEEELNRFNQLLPPERQQACLQQGQQPLDLIPAPMLDESEFAGNKDDDDDFHDFGPCLSVGPPDEQMADETYEQYEERILTKRTSSMVNFFRSTLDGEHDVSFSNIIRNNVRKEVAQKFYTLLVLKKQHILEIMQDDPYGDIIISKGDKFDA